MLQNFGRSRVIACHSRDIGKYITVLLSLEIYKWWKGKMVTGLGCGLGIGGCKRLCHRGCGAWPGYTAFLVWSVKDWPLYKILGKL